VSDRPQQLSPSLTELQLGTRGHRRHYHLHLTVYTLANGSSTASHAFRQAGNIQPLARPPPKETILVTVELSRSSSCRPCKKTGKEVAPLLHRQAHQTHFFHHVPASLAHAAFSNTSTPNRAASRSIKLGIEISTPSVTFLFRAKTFAAAERDRRASPQPYTLPE